jgi:hypothetical protein
MKFLLILILSLYINQCFTAPTTVQPPTDKPLGAYYCQARCLASCLETYLAPTLDECIKFCPPFDANVPCPEGDMQCWRACGVPESAITQPAPESTTFVQIHKDQQELDPYTIELAWQAVSNASVYIIEFYPLNRQSKPGESNFFRAMTTSLAYSVRKEDECIQYDARVIAVNSYGVSIPTYTHIEAPSPSFTTGQHFSVRAMQRDPSVSYMITVTIDYTFPSGWPIEDINIDGIRVTATDCKDPNFALSSSTGQYPFESIIGKTPTAAIQVSFFEDVLKADCLFQMRLISSSTRCNTTTFYDEAPSLAPGVDFRINCDTVPGACSQENSTSSAPSPVAPIPVPLVASIIDPDAVVPPVNLPKGISQPDQQVNNTDDISMIDMPTPPPLPIFVISDNLPVVPSQSQPMPPGSSVSIIEISKNGSGVQSMEIIPQLVAPPLCEQDMLDVQPVLSPMSPSLIDLTITWLERQPLPPPPPPTYFIIRYGPLVRQLVDDDRKLDEIVPGYETFVRTGQQSLDGPILPDPTREINVSGLQRSSLLKLQICAIYDPNSEPLIKWDTIPSHRVDLAALEPFLELENTQTFSPMTSTDIQNAANGAMGLAISNVGPLDPLDPSQPTQIDQDQVEVPVIIAVQTDPDTSSTLYWITIMAGMMLLMLTAFFVFICLRRMCRSRRRMVKIVDKEPKSMIFVTTPQPPPPAFNEVVKVPIV